MSDKDKKNATSFQPGKSGNPGGRSPRVGPNGETLASMIRARTLELVNRAFEIALDKKTETKEALSAIFGLLDRGHGKPKEADDGTNTGKTGVEELLALLAAKLPD